MRGGIFHNATKHITMWDFIVGGQALRMGEMQHGGQHSARFHDRLALPSTSDAKEIVSKMQRAMVNHILGSLGFPFKIV